MAAVSGSHTMVHDLVRHKPKACTVGPITCSREQGEGDQVLRVLVSTLGGLWQDHTWAWSASEPGNSLTGLSVPLLHSNNKIDQTLGSHTAGRCREPQRLQHRLRPGGAWQQHPCAHGEEQSRLQGLGPCHLQRPAVLCVVNHALLLGIASRSCLSLHFNVDEGDMFL